jgi:hypothetical protein
MAQQNDEMEEGASRNRVLGTKPIRMPIGAAFTPKVTPRTWPALIPVVWELREARQCPRSAGLFLHTIQPSSLALSLAAFQARA